MAAEPKPQLPGSMWASAPPPAPTNPGEQYLALMLGELVAIRELLTLQLDLLKAMKRSR